MTTYIYNLTSLLFTLILLSNPFTINSQTFQLTQKLGTNDHQPADNLGISSAISDSFMLAGAWWAESTAPGDPIINEQGAAYLYQLNGNGQWIQIQQLNSINPEALGYYGFRVAIEGDYALIGAFNEDHSGFGNAGRVYCYKMTSNNMLTLIDVLSAPDAANADYFGYDVSLTGGYALIGAYNQDLDENGNNPLEDAGAAYLYKLNNDKWSLTKKLVSPQRKAGDEFGRLVDIDKYGFVIGAFQSEGANSEVSSGSAYTIYCESGFSNWNCNEISTSNLIRLTPNDSGFFEDFGWDVAISNDWIVVGKSSESDQPDSGIAGNTGAAYFFKYENQNWIEKQKVYASDFKGNTFFGRCIGIDNNTAVIGAGSERTDAMGNNPINGAGAAYVFELNDNEVWNETQKITGNERTFNDLFAEDALAISGNHIVAGAWRADTINGQFLIDGGAVYVFERKEVSTSLKPLQKLDDFISVYPNPSNGALKISALTSQSIHGNITIISGHGIIVEEFIIQNNSEINTNLNHLPSGIYFIKYENFEGVISLQKWIKY